MPAEFFRSVQKVSAIPLAICLMLSTSGPYLWSAPEVAQQNGDKALVGALCDRLFEPYSLMIYKGLATFARKQYVRTTILGYDQMSDKDFRKMTKSVNADSPGERALEDIKRSDPARLLERQVDVVWACESPAQHNPDPRYRFLYGRSLELAGLYGQSLEVGLYANSLELTGDQALGMRPYKEKAAHAMQPFKEAADAGYAPAMGAIGEMYELGYGVLKDQSAAVSWYEKGAAAGDTFAMLRLGTMCLEGRGVSQSDEQAASWFTKAAAAGNPEAMIALGNSYADGRGVSHDDAAAASWFRKAADLGSLKGMHDLGYAYETGRGVPKSPADALLWYRKAAKLGDPMAVTYIGMLYLNGNGVEKNEGTAAYYLKMVTKEAAGSETAGLANYILGTMYETGNGVEQDLHEAWYRYLLATNTYDRAKLNLGLLYQKGQGTPRDLNEARKLFAEAAKSSDLSVAGEGAKLLAGVPTPNPLAAQREPGDPNAFFGALLARVIGLNFLAAANGNMNPRGQQDTGYGAPNGKHYSSYFDYQQDERIKCAGVNAFGAGFDPQAVNSLKMVSGCTF